MSGGLRRTAGAALALLLPAAALAAGGGEDEGGELAHFFWEALNLAVLGVVLFLVGRKPVSAYLAERRSGVEENLESAEKLLHDAEARLAEWTAKADGLEREVADIKRKAHAAAEAEGRRIVAEAEKIASRIRAEATAAIERETQRARHRLRDEAADLAVELAEEALRQEVNDGDRERLVEEFVTRVQEGGGGGSA